MWEVLDECLLLLLLIIHVYCRKLSMINQEKNMVSHTELHSWRVYILVYFLQAGLTYLLHAVPTIPTAHP